MHLEGIPLAPLGTLQDSLYQAVWTRREQMRIFETLINVLASGLSLNPSVSKKIEKLMDEYINLVIPGAEQAKKSRYSLISMNCGISQNFSLNVQRGKLQHRKTVVR